MNSPGTAFSGGDFVHISLQQRAKLFPSPGIDLHLNQYEYAHFYPSKVLPLTRTKKNQLTKMASTSLSGTPIWPTGRRRFLMIVYIIVGGRAEVSEVINKMNDL